jgi:hypothetical protein
VNKARGSWGQGLAVPLGRDVWRERERWKGHVKEDEVSFLLVFRTSHSIQREKNRRGRIKIKKVTKIV